MHTDRYKLASRLYDLATLAYSGGAIWRTRQRCFDELESRESQREGPARQRGPRVLLPGPGTGRSAVLAAELGARVVAVERSAAMLSRANRRAQRRESPVEFVHGTLDSLAEDARFDLVVAEHFLNVFSPDAMASVRDRLIAHVVLGGHFAIADFAPLDRERAAPVRALQRIHHVIPLAGCAMLTRNAMHPIYDHGADLCDHGALTLVRTYDAKSYRIGPRWFRTWIFRRAASAHA